MNERTREKTIGDLQYKFLMPPVMQGFPLVTRTLTVLGPLLTPFLEMLRSGQENDGNLGFKTLNVEAFAAAIGLAPSEKINTLLTDSWSISKLHCNNVPISDNLAFEQHFGQHPENLFPVLSWLLWEMVKPFFPKLENFDQEFSKMKGKGSLSPKDGLKIGG